MRVVEKIKKIVKSYLEMSALLEDLFGYYNGVTIYYCPNCNQPYFSNTPQPEPDNGFTDSTLISIGFAKQDKCPYCNKPLKELIIPLNEYLNTINSIIDQLDYTPFKHTINFDDFVDLIQQAQFKIFEKFKNRS